MAGSSSHSGSPQRTTLSAEALTILSDRLGHTKTAVVHNLDHDLSWYRNLPAAQRASLGTLAQQGVQEFTTWLTSSTTPPRPHMGQVLQAIFGDAPIELARTITLSRASQLLRSILESVEAELPAGLPEPDASIVREGVLRYAREIAFALADIYARAAERRGAWDTRLEALLLDAVIRGEKSDEVHSRAAALGWQSRQGILVVVGHPTLDDQPNRLSVLRKQAQRNHIEVLIGEFSEQLVLVLGGLVDSDQQLRRFHRYFAQGPVVYGPLVDDLVQAHHSAQEAIAGFRAVCAWPDAPRPVAAVDLLPERVLNQDPLARRTLLETVYLPLAEANPTALRTVETYIQNGHSLEATAREMFIHANTVRYRLKQVYQITGYNPLAARDAYTLQIGLATGRLSTARHSA